MSKTKAKPKSNPLKKVQFGSIAAKKQTARKQTVHFPDNDGKAAPLADKIIDLSEKAKALDSAKKLLTGEVTPYFFGQASGRSEIDNTIAVPAETGEVTVSFQHRCRIPGDEQSLESILNGRLTDCFRQAFEIAVDGDKIPADKAQDLIDRLQRLFQEFGALEALSVKETLKPTPDFHTRRHLDLTIEENLALNEVAPIVTQVRAKRR